MNKVIKRYFYKGVENYRTANEAFIALAELIKKEESYHRPVNAALQASHKNKPVEISSKLAEQQFNPGNAKWKQKQFPLLKTGNNNFIGYLKLGAATKLVTDSKNQIIDLVLFFKDKMHQLIVFKNYKAIIHPSINSFACLG